GVVPVFNVNGVKSGALKLDGATLARIFLGDIRTWDDPAIAGLNPGLKLPSDAIAVVHRADGSGTTFVFTTYLSGVSGEWKGKVGVGTSVEWPAGIGAKGNDGVANNVRQTPGAIGYLELAYSLQNDVSHAAMINKAGSTVEPSLVSLSIAAANADWASSPGL